MNKQLIIFSLFFGLIACKQDIQKTNASNTQEPVSMAQQVISVDSYRLYSIMELDSKLEVAVKIPIPESALEAVELLGGNEDASESEVTVIPLSLEQARTFIDVESISTLYFYLDLMEEGHSESLKRVDYCITPMDSYFLAVYDNTTKSAYDYASDRSAVETTCVLKKQAKLPKSIQSVIPKNAEVSYYECGDRGHHLYFITTPDRSEIFFYKDEENPALVYSSRETNMVFDLKPLPIFIKGKPILLASVGDAESDAFDERYLIYNGSKYVVNDDNVITKEME